MKTCKCTRFGSKPMISGLPPRISLGSRRTEIGSFRALALKNANAIFKENLAFITLKSSTSKNGKGKYCKFFAILATVQF